jgi:hypothetical protein
MNNNLTHQPIEPDALDHALMNEEPLVPSSGFTFSVMDTVRHEAAQPAPIPFPWSRFLPGITIALALLVWISWGAVQQLFSQLGSIDLSITLPDFIHPTMHVGTAGWLLIALAASLLPLLLVRKLMGSSAYL